MRQILVLQQKSTGKTILQEKTDLNLTKWQKLAAKKVLRSSTFELFWQAIKDDDYVAAWYGPDYDKFMRRGSKKVREEVCSYVFKESPEDRLTPKETVVLLRRISAAYRSIPFEVKPKVRKYYVLDILSGV